MQSVSGRIRTDRWKKKQKEKQKSEGKDDAKKLKMSEAEGAMQFEIKTETSEKSEVIRQHYTIV